MRDGDLPQEFINNQQEFRGTVGVHASTVNWVYILMIINARRLPYEVTTTIDIYQTMPLYH